MAADKEAPINNVSKVMSRAFSLKSVSNYGVSTLKNKALVHEFLFFHMPAYSDLEIFLCGSAVEGTYLAESDFDFMIVKRDIIVQTTKTVPEGVCSPVLVLDTSGSRTGFGRLRLFQLDDTEYYLFHSNNLPIRDIVVNMNDEMYISSEKFQKVLVSKLESIYSTRASLCQHGPCAKIQHHDRFYLRIDKNVESDQSHAIQMDQWPVEANEWITRKRLYNWPPKKVVHKISRQKCHVVPVGDARSIYCSLEWRISFILGERELIWNFNNTQVQCYVILKRLLKTYIEPCAPDQLSSYHLKTIIFWLSEEKGMSMWNDENLLQCVLESLIMLKRCVVKGELQHYFLRQRNLLTYKFENVSEKECVLLKIDEVRKDIIPLVLKCVVEFESLSEMWNSSNGNAKKFIEDMVKIRVPVLYAYEQSLTKANGRMLYTTMCIMFQDIILESGSPYDVICQYAALERNPPKDIEPPFLNMAKIFLHIRIGMAYFSHIIDPMDKQFQEFIQEKRLTIQNAEQLLSSAKKIDSFAGRLYLASHFFCQDRYSESNDITLTVLKQKKILMYCGRCSTYEVIQLTLEGKASQEHINESHIRKKGINPAFDVVFSSQDLLALPYPVQFECAVSQYSNFRGLVIHPCVYAYLLLCIGHHRIGAPFHEFLSQLEEAVQKTTGGFQRHHALNLLGFCYKLDGNLKEAFRCFRESLEDTRNFKSGENAAVYHIILSLLEAKENKILCI